MSTVPLNWKKKGLFESWCTSIDLNVMDKHGCGYTVLDGIEFESRVTGSYLFKCMNPFKKEKLRQDVYKDAKNVAKYSVSMREACKLYLNSLSGKVI